MESNCYGKWYGESHIWNASHYEFDLQLMNGLVSSNEHNFVDVKLIYLHTDISQKVTKTYACSFIRCIK